MNRYVHSAVISCTILAGALLLATSLSAQAPAGANGQGGIAAAGGAPGQRTQRQGMGGQRPAGQPGQGGQRPAGQPGQGGFGGFGGGQGGQRPAGQPGQGGFGGFGGGQGGQRPAGQPGQGGFGGVGGGQGGQRPAGQPGQGGQRPGGQPGQGGFGGFGGGPGMGGFGGQPGMGGQQGGAGTPSISSQIKEKFPEDYAEAQKLRVSNPKAYREKMRDLQRKLGESK